MPEMFIYLAKRDDGPISKRFFFFRLESSTFYHVARACVSLIKRGATRAVSIGWIGQLFSSVVPNSLVSQLF